MDITVGQVPAATLGGMLSDVMAAHEADRQWKQQAQAMELAVREQTLKDNAQYHQLQWESVRENRAARIDANRQSLDFRKDEAMDRNRRFDLEQKRLGMQQQESVALGRDRLENIKYQRDRDAEIKKMLFQENQRRWIRESERKDASMRLAESKPLLKWKETEFNAAMKGAADITLPPAQRRAHQVRAEEVRQWMAEHNRNASMAGDGGYNGVSPNAPPAQDSGAALWNSVFGQ